MTNEHVNEVLMKCRTLFPETPEMKHAASIAKKVESRDMTKLLLKRNKEHVRSVEVMAHARAAKVTGRQIKGAKTVEGSL